MLTGGGGKGKGRSGSKAGGTGGEGSRKGDIPFTMNGVSSSPPSSFFPSSRSFFSSPSSSSSSSFFSSSVSPDHHLWISSLIWPDIPLDVSISCVCVNPKGSFLATGTHAGHIYLWHLNSLHAAISASTSTEGQPSIGKPGISDSRRIFFLSPSSSSEVQSRTGKKASFPGLSREQRERTRACENLVAARDVEEKEKRRKKKNGENERCEEGYKEEEESRTGELSRGERRGGGGGLDDPPIVIPSEGSLEEEEEGEEEAEKHVDSEHRCSFHSSPADIRKTIQTSPDLSYPRDAQQPSRSPPHSRGPGSQSSSSFSSSFELPLPFLPHLILISDWGGAAALIECGFGLSSSPLLQASSEEVLVSIHSDNKLRIWSLLEGRCLSVTKHFPFPLLSMRILSDRRYVLLQGSTGVFVFDLWCRCRVCYLSLSSLSLLRAPSHISPSTSFQRSFNEPFLSPVDSPAATATSTPSSKDSRRGDSGAPRNGVERREKRDSFERNSSSLLKSSPPSYAGAFQNQQQEHQPWPFLSLVSCSTNAPPDCSVHTVERLRSFFPDFLLPSLPSSCSSLDNTSPSYTNSFEKPGEDKQRQDGKKQQEEEELDALLQQYYSQHNATPTSPEPSFSSCSSFLPSILEQPIVVAGVTTEGRVAIWDLRPVLLLWEEQQRELDHLGGASLFHGAQREYVVFSHLAVDEPRRRKCRAQSSPSSHRRRATTVDSRYSKNAPDTEEVQREGRGEGEEREGEGAIGESRVPATGGVAEGVNILGGSRTTRLRKHSLNAGGGRYDGISSPRKGRKQGGGKRREEDEGILGPGSAVFQPMRTMFGGMFRAGGGGGTSTEEVGEEDEDNDNHGGGLNPNIPRGVEPVFLSPVCCPVRPLIYSQVKEDKRIPAESVLRRGCLSKKSLFPSEGIPKDTDTRPDTWEVCVHRTQQVVARCMYTWGRR